MRSEEFAGEQEEFVPELLQSIALPWVGQAGALEGGDEVVGGVYISWGSAHCSVFEPLVKVRRKRKLCSELLKKGPPALLSTKRMCRIQLVRVKS